MRQKKKISPDIGWSITTFYYCLLQYYEHFLIESQKRYNKSHLHMYHKRSTDYLYWTGLFFELNLTLSTKSHLKSLKNFCINLEIKKNIVLSGCHATQFILMKSKWNINESTNFNIGILKFLDLHPNILVLPIFYSGCDCHKNIFLVCLFLNIFLIVDGEWFGVLHRLV